MKKSVPVYFTGTLFLYNILFVMVCLTQSFYITINNINTFRLR